MLKREPKGKFIEKYMYMGLFRSKKWYYHFSVGKYSGKKGLLDEEYKNLIRIQESSPVAVMVDSDEKKTWWMFKGEFYVEDEGYSSKEIRALVLYKLMKKEATLKRALSYTKDVETDLSGRRKPIPDDVKMFVWQRDSGKCVKCGSRENLEFDHIIPLSKGGSNTARNIQLLCEKCNREKHDNLV